jgi:hypothetical protein
MFASSLSCANTNRDPLPIMQRFESRAWGVTVMSAITSEEKTLTVPGGYVAWNNSWSDADKQKQIPSAVSGYLAQWAGLSR